MVDPTDLINCAFAIGDTTPLGSVGETTSTRMHPDDLKAILNSVRVDSPWLSAKEAAEYLRCPLSRVRKLTMTSELPHEHDGRRVLYHRDALDAFIEAGGAKR
jgi:excisionase family DNA binding protein